MNETCKHGNPYYCGLYEAEKSPEELESLEMRKQGYPYCWLDGVKDTHCSACRDYFRKANKKI